MKTPTALSVTSSQREQTSLRFQVPRLPRSNVCSTRDLENPSASVHLKRFSTPSLTLKILCTGKLNPRKGKQRFREKFYSGLAFLVVQRPSAPAARAARGLLEDKKGPSWASRKGIGLCF